MLSIDHADKRWILEHTCASEQHIDGGFGISLSEERLQRMMLAWRLIKASALEVDMLQNVLLSIPGIRTQASDIVVLKYPVSGTIVCCYPDRLRDIAAWDMLKCIEGILQARVNLYLCYQWSIFAPRLMLWFKVRRDKIDGYAKRHGFCL